MASLAELLDYDQRKKQALQALTDYASSQYKLGSAFGEGLSDQAKGLWQTVRHPIDTAVDTATNIYQAGKAAIQDPRAVYQAAKEGLTEAVSSPQNIARFAGQNFNPLELANALNKVGTMRELTVYHGTPHKFEPTRDNPLGEFTASKIGTGEGAASYGHGIYLAQNPKVAEAYKERLTANKYTKDDKYVNADQIWSNAFVSALDASKAHPDQVANVVAEIKNWVEDGEDVNDFLRHSRVSPELRPAYEAAIKEYQGSTKNPGHRYTVDLPDEKIDQMLDWDKPLGEQSAYVQKVIEDLRNDPNVYFPKFDTDAEGQKLYRFIGVNKQAPIEFGGKKYINSDPATVSELLRQRGIPGIKYLDEQSRAKGAGTRNFVVFPGEEKNLKILSRE